MEEVTHSKSGGRVPPQDIETERSLLGAIMISDGVMVNVSTILKPEDFYDKRHQIIYGAMMNLWDAHKPIDLVTITNELKTQKKLNDVGKATYLAELSNLVTTGANAKAYAEIVERAAMRRKLIAAGTDIVEKAYEEDANVNELVGEAEKELFKVSDKVIKSDYKTMDALTAEAFERIEALYKNKGTLRGLKTGFSELDKKTAGFQKGDLIIIGARPAMGKTTFAQNLAFNFASIGKGVLFFSMEMASSEIVDRMVSSISGVDNWKVRTGNLTNDEINQVDDALADLSDMPLYIDDTSSMDVMEVRNKARRAMHDNEISAVVIDYLQLIQGSARYAGQRVQEVTEISRNLKIMARELDIPVIALAQLSRNVTGRDNPRPILSDIRESGSIEQDADLVMFLHRDDYYHQNEKDYENTNITELILAKHRHGAIGTIELYFKPELLRFISLDKTHE